MASKTRSRVIYGLLIVLAIAFGVRQYVKYRIPPTIAFENLELVDLNGNEVSLSDYEGKHLFLNFWATWCPPCRAELPDLEIAQEKLKDDDFVFLLISDEPIEKLQGFTAQFPYDLIFLKSLSPHSDQGVHTIPTSYIVDANGEVKYDEVGERLWGDDEVVEELKSYVE